METCLASDKTPSGTDEKTNTNNIFKTDNWISFLLSRGKQQQSPSHSRDVTTCFRTVLESSQYPLCFFFFLKSIFPLSYVGVVDEHVLKPKEERCGAKHQTEQCRSVLFHRFGVSPDLGIVPFSTTLTDGAQNAKCRTPNA
mmetsp:Transcript_39672/g.101908  ORF Transcript_39672/g.101908 Transcript_39672/m.101908 type:complete len:141 (-) Transcript_39672:1421-1843(-)